MTEGTFDTASKGSTLTICCLGQVRWVPLSSMQAHRNKLQQLFEVVEYRNGSPYERREEWRDVPVSSD